MKLGRGVFIIFALMLIALPGLAQDASTSPSTQALKDAGKKMHRDMMIVYSGDTDSDFVRGMLAHHQGAVDMAKVELQYGSDPDIKKLAQDIVDSQTREIAMMNEWIKRHGQTPAH